MIFRAFIDRLNRLVRKVFFWLPSATPQEEEMPEAVHDHALVIAVTSPERVPKFRQFRYALRIFSRTERRALVVATAAIVVSLGVAAVVYGRARIVNVPVVGGTFTEALVGQPKYLNPLDATSNDVDSDLVRLIYSGLFHFDGLEPVPDLAEQYGWSEDGKSLTVKLRADARFHDGKPLTSEDVRFTYDSLGDPSRKSPLAPLFRGVAVEAVDRSTVRFALEYPDATFLSKLTVGILPADLWQDVPAANAKLSDLNIKPVGSGPYRVKSFLRDNLGNVRSYTLERFDRYGGIAPNLKTLIFQFFPDRQQATDAYKGDVVDALAFVSTKAAEKLGPASRSQDVRVELPEETIAFFNLKDKVLANKDVRTALSLVVNRADIVSAQGGLAVAVTGPYPFASSTSAVVDIERARTLLMNAGWVIPQNGNIRIWAPVKKVEPPKSKKKTPDARPPTPAPSATSTAPIATPSSTELALVIGVPDEPDLLAVADQLKREWSLLGARVTIDALPTEELMRKATRERTHQVVLLNVFLGPEQDPLPFWWSGQNIDRGLNISGLVDRNVDDALEAARKATSTSALVAARARASSAILAAVPAVFLIRPTHHYLVSSKVKGVSENLIITRPAERFQDLMRWYQKTGWRWK